MNIALVEITERLEALGRYSSLVNELSSDFPEMSFVFEALFANYLESNEINLDYEVNVNANNNSSVDFCFQIGRHSKFYFELVRPKMKDELKEKYNATGDEGFHGVSLRGNHEKEYLRPEAQTIYLQEKLLAKVEKFPAPQEDCYSVIVVDCSNIHFGHFDDEDCRMVMFGRTKNIVWQEEWLDKNGKTKRIKGLLEQELQKRETSDFRGKITSVIFIPQISPAPLERAYIVSNIHRTDSHQRSFKNTLLNMPPFQTIQWIESPQNQAFHNEE